MRNNLIGLILSVTVLTGCAQMAVMEATDQGRAPELVIASDLVNALMQVDGYHPSTTRLQIQKSPKQAFGKTLNSVLVSVGYDIEYVSSPIGDRFVDYTLSDRKNSAGSIPKTYHLSVGEVEFKRDYEIVSGRVQPASNLLMAGVDPMMIKLNDHIFGLDVAPDPAEQQQERTEQQQPVSTQTVSTQNNVQAEVQPETTTPTFQNVNIEQPEVVHQVTDQLGSSIDLLVNGEATPSDYSEGDNLIFTIRSQSDARLSCYYQDPDGSVIRVYPNRFAPQSNIQAGELVHIPASDEWALQATRAGANDEVMCLSVDLEQDAAMSEFESTPDLEPLAVSSLDQLLVELKLQTGITPQTKRLSVQVN